IIAPGVRMVASASFNPHSLTVASGPIGGGYAPINGFNSTQGGQRHMHFISGSGSVATNQIVYFLFDQPVSAFSTFITGHGEGDGFIGPGMTTITAQPAAGGLSSTVFVNDWHTHNPNVRFAGFTDSAKGFNRATVQLRTYSSEYEWRGSFSFDDVRWVYAPIPEPGALLLIAGVVPGLSLLRRRL
ncbi:MAG TPA: hypothetical protein PJ982_10400, partial [Lacipirellulaceae bacterium]|nr:hypothetical protein [Lacipirellulaceae bacterium]